jgi:hypothetical protein
VSRLRSLAALIRRLVDEALADVSRGDVPTSAIHDKTIRIAQHDTGSFCRVSARRRQDYVDRADVILARASTSNTAIKSDDSREHSPRTSGEDAAPRAEAQSEAAHRPTSLPASTNAHTRMRGTLNAHRERGAGRARFPPERPVRSLSPRPSIRSRTNQRLTPANVHTAAANG